MGRASEDLRATLSEIFGVRLDADRFDVHFEASLRRSWGMLAQEFAALVLAECWIDFSGGKKLNQDAVERIFGRVRKRLEREARKTQQLHAERLDTVAAKAANDPPYDLDRFLRSLTAEELVWFVGRFMDRRPVAEMASQMNEPDSTAYYKLKLLREKFRKYLDDAKE